MEQELYNKLLNDISVLKSKLDKKTIKKLDLELIERIVKRLYSLGCEECNKYLEKIQDQVLTLNQNINNLNIKEYKKLKNSIISYLQKKYNLVTEGYYIGVYMSLGVSLGIVFGVAVFKDNLALGLPIGISIGTAIGAAKDQEAKKKGLVI